MTGRLGLYLHIPFCRSKCRYCDFPSFAGMDRWQPKIIDKMTEELRVRRGQLGDRVPTTVYVGGGTPSVLRPELMEKLLYAAHECFPWSDQAEFTMEMNPGTVNRDFIRTARRFGLNRVSLGAQSANDRLLEQLGRIHTADEIRAAVRMLREEGVFNLNLDMMIGLPDQAMDDVRDTVKAFVALAPTHISCYSLIVEEGTPMYDAVQHGQVSLPEETLEREMYEEARQMLEQAGYHQYEISNFARDGYRCRHNVDCWNCEEYLGVGVSAASLIGNTRFRNPPTLSGYLQDHAPETIELTEEDKRFESVMLGLRLTDGLRADDFQQRHHIGLEDAYGAVIRRMTDAGLLEWRGGALRCTRKGLDVQNEILTEFL